MSRPHYTFPPEVTPREAVPLATLLAIEHGLRTLDLDKLLRGRVTASSGPGEDSHPAGR